MSKLIITPDKQFSPLKKYTKLDSSGEVQNSSWYLHWLDKNKKRRCKKILLDYKHQSLPAIRKLAISIYEKEINKSTNFSNGLTYNDCWNDYIKELKIKNTKTLKNIIASYENDVKNEIGHIELENLTTNDVNKMFQKVTSRGAKDQANTCLKYTKAALKVAMLNEKVSNNVASIITKHKEKEVNRIYTEEEKALILLELRNRLQKNPKLLSSVSALLFCMATGCRIGEITNAKWKEFKGDRIILKKHKTDSDGHERIIYLNETAKKIINQLPERSPDDYILLVRSPRRLWDSVRRSCNCEDIRIHDLRHSFGSWGLSSKKMQMIEIGKLMGHKSIVSTARYMHLNDDLNKSNSQIMDETLSVDVPLINQQRLS